jgi:uncharacterized glyoxalase superfamily protein PhnB
MFEAIIKATGVGPGTSMLDVGCGAGLFCKMASDAGAAVAGFDAAEQMIAMARSRVPMGDFRVGDMEALPFADNSFDLVTGVNSFQFAANPVRALSEACRVAKPRASVVIATWGKPEDCEASAYLAALKPLSPPAPQNAPGPFALSKQEALEGIVRQAGLQPAGFHEVDAPFIYPNLEIALRGLLSAGPAIRAIQTSGEEKVRQAVTEVLERFRQPGGGYRMNNKFMFLVASRVQNNYFRPGLRTITPYLLVNDAEALIAFAKSAFGAHEVMRVPREDGSIMHAELQIGDSRVELAQVDPKSQHFRGAMPGAIHIYVPNTDATYQRAVAAGAKTITAPHDAPYGDRAANVIDSCGNYWFIATWMGK